MKLTYIKTQNLFTEVNLLRIQLFPFWKILPQMESAIAQCSII